MRNSDGSAVNTTGTAYTSNTAQTYYQIYFAGNQNHWCSLNSGKFNGILVYATIDSTYIRVEAQTWSNLWYAYFPDATRVQGTIALDSSGQATDSAADSITDRNGNTETITQNCVIGQACTTALEDGHGRSIEIQYSSNPGSPNGTWSDTISWPGVTQPLTATINWENYQFAPANQFTCTAPYFLTGSGTSYTCGGPPPYASVVTSAQLPPASAGGPAASYAFSYNASSASGWGEVHTLTMNSGGQPEYFVQYAYQYDNSTTRPFGNIVNPVASCSLNYEEVRDDAINTPTLLTETTSYSIPLPTSTAISGTTTVTAPDGVSTTQIYFANLCTSSNIVWTDFCAPLVYKMVAPDQTTIMETGWASNTAPPGMPSGAFANPFAQYTVETHSLSPSGATVRGIAVSQDQNGNPTVSAEYDWSSTAPSRNSSNVAGVSVVGGLSGSPLRTTTTVPYAQNPYWTSRAPNYPEAAFLRSIQCVTTGALAPSFNCNNAPAGNSVSKFVYDGYATTGNLVQLQQYDNTNGSYISTGWSYLTNGNLSSTTDPNQNLTQISYDSQNLCPIKTVVSGLRTTTYSQHAYLYNNTSNSGDPNNGLTISPCVPDSETDADNSITTTYVYDNLGRQTGATQTGKNSLSRTTTTIYDDVGLSVKTTQQLTPSQNLTSTTAYDAVGRVRLTIDSAGSRVQKAYRYATGGAPGSYELASNPYASNTNNTDPSMGWTLTTRDRMGRVAKVQDYGQDHQGDSPPAPWGSGANVTGTATTAYDQSATGCNSPATNSTDEANNTRIQCTDGLGRQTGVIEPNGNLTTYGYDLLDNLTAVNVPGQNSRTFAYSTLSRLTSATNPEQTAPISYVYDANGNLHQQTDARGTVTLYGSYDGLNRVSSKTYTAGGNTAPTSTVTYQYDLDFKGALSSVSAGTNSTTYTHDGFGRIVTSAQSTAGIVYPQFQYQYSLLDDLAQITYPSGRVVSYTLDAAGRVGGVSGAMAGVTTPYVSALSYTAASAPLTIPFNNGVTESHTWNDRFQHTSVSAGSLLTLNFYPCDQGQTQCSSGNNGKIWRQDISVNGSFQASQSYQYDALNRLSAVGERKAQASFTPGCSDSSAVWSQQFNYDAPGNRTVNCRGGNAVSPPWEVSSISSATNRVLDSGWTYDAAGNITASPYAPSITYDAENRQVAFCGQLAQGGGCAALTQYLYDGDGQRVQKLTASGTVTYVYDAFGNLAAEYGGTPGANGTQYVTG
ncbi:MAG: hypothetical protein WBY44_00115, partial [Bryobacteraceae bacterium]